MGWLGLKKALKKSLALQKAPIAYHGSTRAFEEHSRPKKDPKSTLNYGPGIYYATDPEEASAYAQPQIGRVSEHAEALTQVQSKPEYKAYRDQMARKFGLSSSVDTRHKNWRKFADHMLDYDYQKVAEHLNLAPNVRRSDVQVKNPFNPHSKEHALEVYKVLGQEPNMARLEGESNAGANLYHHIANHPIFDGQEWGERTHKLNRAIKAAGFDGIHDEKLGHIIAFSPKQIKPAYSAEQNPKKMAASELAKSPVRSPRKGHTIAQLERLKQDNWHNPDTGTEISEGEGEEYLWQLRQQKADKQLKQMVNPKQPKPSTDKPEDWFGSSEKMKKGVARRLFPFNPQKVSQTERADVNEWQTYGNEPAPDVDYFRDPQTAREELDLINPHAKQRALLKLASYTKARKNPTTGEREFLLHRGVLGHEHDYVTDGENYSYNSQRSSWTPRYDKAKLFTKPEGHSVNENFEHPEEESRPGQVISAWIPESKIVHAPYMYGGISSPHSRGENDYRKEHEIIVAPHQGKMVPHTEADWKPNPRSHRIAELSHQAKKRAEQKQFIEAKMKQPLQPKLPKKPKKADPNQLELPLAASEKCECDIKKGKIGPKCKQKLKAYSRRKGWQYPSAVVHLQAGRICGSKTKSEETPTDLKKDLRRWVKEKWANPKGETHHGSGKSGWRPTVKVSEKTPTTWGEMSSHQKKKKVENKRKANKRGGGWSTHESGRKQVWNTKKSELEKADPSAPAVKINPEHGKIIANAYENMKHDPNHPEVKAAYGALIDETKKQFKDMLNQGFRFSAIKQGQENPYKTSKDLHADIEQNKHMHFFPTEQGFGSEGSAPSDHPMLQPTEFVHEGKPLLANDLFRIVHDYRAHHLGGKSTFGPKGEHQAYLTHKKDFSPLAQKALATETMGQNSWVTAGPYAEHNKKNPHQTIYAEQKAGLLPEAIINGKWHGEE